MVYPLENIMGSLHSEDGIICASNIKETPDEYFKALKSANWRF